MTSDLFLYLCFYLEFDCSRLVFWFQSYKLGVKTSTCRWRHVSNHIIAAYMYPEAASLFIYIEKVYVLNLDWGWVLEFDMLPVSLCWGYVYRKER